MKVENEKYTKIKDEISKCLKEKSIISEKTKLELLNVLIEMRVKTKPKTEYYKEYAENKHRIHEIETELADIAT